MMAQSGFDAEEELYEYDAPSQVVDLKELQNAEVDDKWFEEQAMGADKHLRTPRGFNPLFPVGEALNLPIAVVHLQDEDADAGARPSSHLAPLPNIVTSWAGASLKQTGARPKMANNSSVQPGRVVKRKTQTTTGAAPPSKKQKSTSQKESDILLQRRKPSTLVSKENKTPRGPTVPKPFNLSMGTKRKTEKSTFVPMAQLIQQFQSRTPDRYHLRSRKDQGKGLSPVKGEHLKLTHPVSPRLVTKQRNRPATTKGQAELESEELSRLKSYKFKALELNKRIMEGAEALKKPPAKEPTVPEGFDLQIETRLRKRQANKPRDEEKPNPFKSQPLPKKILEGVVGLPERKVVPPTVPQSPAFAPKRIHREPEVEEVTQPPQIKACPVPHFGVPFQLHLPEEHQIEVCPFSFQEREEERRTLNEKRLEERRLEESQVPQFKAQPLPDFDAVVLPEKKKLEATKPEPFRLLVDQRGAVKSARLEKMAKEEQKQLKDSTVFKARPNIVTHKEPFQPRKENRAAVVPEAFELSTERRARERQEFERAVTEKDAMRAMMEEEQKREEEQREREEIARQRQEKVHKAQPIRHYKPMVLKKSEVPLTHPQSPNFCDRFRF